MRKNTSDKKMYFELSIENLNKARQAVLDFPDSTLYRDAMIRRFDVAMELAWKTIREMLIDLYFSEKDLNSPRNVIAMAYRENFIDDENIWLEMLKERNNVSHIYSEEQAIAVAENIKVKFCKVFTALVKTIK